MKLRFDFKKTVAGAVSVMILTTIAAAQTKTYLNDGYISYSGVAEENSNITMSIVPKEYDLLSDKDFSNTEAIAPVYVGTAISDDEGNYTFNFQLTKNGIYNVYIGVDGEAEAESFKLEFSDIDDNKNVIEELADLVEEEDIDGISSLLSDKRKEFRLYTDLFELADMENTAKLVFDYLKENPENNSDKILTIIEKAMFADALNNDKIDNIDDFKESFWIEGEDSKKYYRTENSDKIQVMMQKDSIKSIEEFDTALLDAILISAINNNDGTGIIKDILTDYKDMFGVSKSSITSALCSAIANEGDFDSIDELKDFVDDYKPQSTNGGGGSGGGGNRNSGKGTMTSGVIPMPTAAAENKEVVRQLFDDVQGDFWASEAITALYEKGIIAGKTETLFYPQDRVKREEFVKMLVTAFRFDIVNDEFYFEDVPKESWYYEYVKSAYLAYVVNGISETEFGSGLDITRQDLSVMIANALDSADVEIPEINEAVEFKDNDEIAQYASGAVLKLQKAGVISGYEDNTFRPYGSATRAEAAYMIHKVLPYIK